MIRLLVVDDHPMLRAGVRAALEGTGIEIVGEADTVASAVREAIIGHPDVVLMDLGLPDGSGIEATRLVLADRPGTAVLAFTMSDDDESVFAALRAGALGYLVKGAPRQELVRAIQVVADGEALFLGPGVARRVQAHFAAVAGDSTVGGAEGGSARGGATPSGATAGGAEGLATATGSAFDPGAAAAFEALTAREREVLQLMAAGWGNQAIASKLFLAPKTVRNNVSSIIGKLQASDRGEAVVRARRQGFGADPE